MKVIEVGKMPDGTKVQIEDWHEDYEFCEGGSIIGAYPVAKLSLDGQFAPVKNKTFRLALHFDNAEQAKQSFDKLRNGEMSLIDYKDHVNNKKLLECL